MAVRKIKINSRLMTGDTISININLAETFTPVDQADIIERDFVKKGVEESINPIVDYERTKYLPVDITNHYMEDVTYSLHLMSGSTYGDIGFVDDDLLYRHNNLKESFLRMSFYDSDEPNNSNKIIEFSIYPQYINPYISLISEPLDFTVSDTMRNPSGFSEGYLIYYDKSLEEVSGKTIYMKAEFNNAKTGKVHRLMVKSTPCVDVADLIAQLFTKYQLKRTISGVHTYYVDNTYSTNVSYVGDNVKIELYEVDIL